VEAPTRFAALAAGQARAILLAAFALLAWVALTWQPSAPLPSSANSAAELSESGAVPQAKKRDRDLMLYDEIIRRVANGENYYVVATEEQRARRFPVRPGLTVRLPTLAVVSAAVGSTGLAIGAAAILILVGWTWWNRLGSILAKPVHRMIALGLLGTGIATGFKPTYFVVHEVWAGMLLALALALHRPGRWRGAWIAAALALAIREHALPFVLLMGALALWRGERREAAAWGVLAAAYLALLWVHIGAVDQLTGPGDPLSPSWLALRGLDGWIENIVLCTGLFNLPAWLAAPLVLLPLLGWAALDDRLGLEALPLFAGYGLLFMLAGRTNNFYWGLMVVPAWFVGLYWVPAALRDLFAAARRAPQSA